MRVRVPPPAPPPGPGGEPLYTDRRGRPLGLGDDGQAVPPSLLTVPFVPVPPGGGEG